MASEVVEFDTASAPPDHPSSVARTTEQRLGDLESLKQKGLITAQEYEAQRKRILEDL